MSNTDFDAVSAAESGPGEDLSFAEMLSSFEQQHAGSETVTGTIVSVAGDTILVNIGRKMEGSLALSKWRETESGDPKAGGSVVVSVGPRNEEGYYELSTVRVERPKDWTGLQQAFTKKLT